MAFNFPTSPTVGQQYAPVPGLTFTWNGYGWDMSNVPSAVALGAGRLVYTSPTSLTFVPHKGDRVKAGGIIYPIPPAGITIPSTGVNVNGTAGQNVAANTQYLVALQAIGSVLTPLFYSSATHFTDTGGTNVGTEVINGNPAASLIGNARTNASAQFSSNAVASWFNRRLRSATFAISNNSTVATAETFMGGGFGVATWMEETSIVALTGLFYNSVAGQYGIATVRDQAGSSVLNSTCFGPGLASLNASHFQNPALPPADGQIQFNMYIQSQSGSNTFAFANAGVTVYAMG
jgi:hypothetical protein